MTNAAIQLWGTTIGAVQWDEAQELAFFEYTPEFQASGIEVAPHHMPLSGAIYSFPALRRTSFQGLPGMLSDSLPDRFGSAILDAWLQAQGRTLHSLNPVERLCYVGKRGMGALEFSPQLGMESSIEQDTQLEVDALVNLASAILSDREAWHLSFDPEQATAAMQDILRVGTSAGGARAKAVVAWNPSTNELRSSQASVPAGFEHWLLKFDGVSQNRDRELADPRGYGQVEYAYYRMARAAGIEMEECRLLQEGERQHFMTRRFDRDENGGKHFMQSLAALLHLDFDLPGSASYEQAMLFMRELDCGMDSLEQQFRRMAFNVVARNQDDHVKNIAFLMDRRGQWSLSPAYDVTYSYNPDGAWTSQHQMTLNGKRAGFTREDFAECGDRLSLARGRALEILDEVRATVARWPEFASEAGVSTEWNRQIAAAHRVASLG